MNMRKILAIVLACLMVLPFMVACTQQPATTEAPKAETTVTEAPKAEEKKEEPKAEEKKEEPKAEEPAAPAEPVYEAQPYGENLATAPTTETPLVVAYSPFSAKFSPFYADTAYDQDVVGMTQIGLMTTDRMGGVIFNAIEGETVPYNGTDYLYKGTADLSVKYDEASDTTTYTAKLRVGMKFSDGEEVTADDVIFTYYTYLDPTYVGSTTLSSYDIVGLQNYRTQTSDEVYAKYSELTKKIFEAGNAGYVANEDYSEDLYNAYWGLIKANWTDTCQAIVNYVANNYGVDAYVQAYANPDWTWEQVAANEGLKIAYGMRMWGFAKFTEEGLKGAVTGKTWDLTTTFPTIEDYYEETYAAYEGDCEAFYETEKTGNEAGTVHDLADAQFIGTYGPQDEAMGGQGVPNIAGIKKIDKYTVEVTVKGFSAPAIYSILGVSVTPLHYYGDVSKYDYENNKFGFDFGDLSTQKSKLTDPMGAGPYKFVKYENKVVYFEANENYFRGCPKIKYIQFKETASAEVATAVTTGDVDAGEMTGSKSRFAEVRSYNSNGELSGDVIATSRVDNLGYGYIGMNADTVNVGGKPASDESKALRKALATVLAVYRGVAYDSYYGDAASVIQYPISNTSWAAPQATDEGYKVAFSVDPDGNDLYTAEMTAEERYAAALAGALKWFEKAGYTVTDGKLTAAPEGAKLSYEAIIPGDGTGDHPSYAVLTNAKEALASIGMELIINDPADSNVLWDALDAGTQELWCAAWGSTIDPDMYQVYHSSGIVGRGGSDSNHYHIADDNLDKMIVDARKSDDQSYRKSVYKQALDLIVDWAVEIPAYQRQNCIIFSSQRINLDTLTPDITTFWGWMNDLEGLELQY